MTATVLASAVMRLGIFLPNWIGDVVMATPALRALRRHFGPQAHLVGVMRPYVAEVLEGTAWLNDAILYTKSPREGELNWRQAIRRLRAERLDAILLLTNSWRTAWMAWWSGAPRRVGIRRDARGWLLSQRIAQPIDPNNGLPLATIAMYLRLAEAMGCAPESSRLELATSADDELAADGVWKRLGLPAGDKVVVLNSGGAFGAAKLWPTEYFAALAQRLVADWNVSVLVNCGPSEREVAREIAGRAADSRVVSLTEEANLPIGLTKACIRRSRLLVTTDSGPRFMAVAFGRPVVTLFGPTDPRMTVTHYDRETCLSMALDCQPCMKRICPLGHHRCMRDLSVDAVYRAVARQLEATPSEHAA